MEQTTEKEEDGPPLKLEGEENDEVLDTPFEGEPIPETAEAYVSWAKKKGL